MVAILAENGFQPVEVDRIGHQVLEDRREQVARLFGPGIRAPDGSIDRRALGKLVFRSPRARRQLERILHPVMVGRVRSRVEGRTGALAINAALLFPMGLQRLCSLVIWVQAPWWVRLFRAMRRDRLPLGDALARILSQRGIRPKSNGIAVDIYYVKNTGDSRFLREQVLTILRERGSEEGGHGKK